MDPNQAAAREPLKTVEEAARAIEHVLLDPALTSERVAAAVTAARRRGLAAVLVRPCDVDLAVRLLEGSAVKVGSAAGFPYGIANTAVKLYEARDLLRRGAREIDLAINRAQLLSREFQSVQTELAQMAETCRKEGARLTVTLEVACLTKELAIVACECCERADAHAVKTGFGLAAPDPPDALALLRESLPDDIAIAPAPAATREALQAAWAFGCDRIGAFDPEALLAGWAVD
jgi:deoxyribose-phosphate aldolase